MGCVLQWGFREYSLKKRDSVIKGKHSEVLDVSVVCELEDSHLPDNVGAGDETRSPGERRLRVDN